MRSNTLEPVKEPAEDLQRDKMKMGRSKSTIRPPKLTTRLLFLALIGTTQACSSTKAPEPEPAPVELQKSSIKAVDTPEVTLFEQGKRHYTNGLYSAARENFEALRDTYSSGPYAEFARIKIPDTYFETGEYGTAGSLYEEFIKAYPSSPSVPYAMLRAGRSYHLSSRGVGRDIAPIEKAKEQYDLLIAKYPGSPYASAAKEFRKAALVVLADHEKFIANFYEKQEREKAAEAREQSYSQRSGEIKKEALERRVAPPRRTTDIPQVIAAQRVRVDPSPPMPLSTLPRTRREDPLPQQDERLTVQKLECEHNGARQIFVYLNQEMSEEELIPKIVMKYFPHLLGMGALNLKLPGVQAKQTVMDCFGRNDLSITSEGSITLAGAKQAELMSLTSPPRLLIIPRY